MAKPTTVDLQFTSADGTAHKITADGKTITVKFGGQTIKGSRADMDRLSTALLSVLLLLEDGEPVKS